MVQITLPFVVVENFSKEGDSRFFRTSGAFLSDDTVPQNRKLYFFMLETKITEFLTSMLLTIQSYEM